VRRNSFPALLILWLPLLTLLADRAHAEWRSFVEPVLGYTVQYPQELFLPPSRDPSDGTVTLVGRDRQSRLLLFGGPNETKADSRELAASLSVMDDIHRVTYTRVTSHWFVLSGYLTDPSGRRGNIFYERIAVSDDGARLAGFRLEYPEQQRSLYDHILGRIGSSLRVLPSSSVQVGLSGKPSLSPETFAERAGESDQVKSHAEWCASKYSTYDSRSDTFRRFDGIRVPCVGP